MKQLLQNILTSRPPIRVTTFGVSSEGVAVAMVGNAEMPPMKVATFANDSRRDTEEVSAKLLFGPAKPRTPDIKERIEIMDRFIFMMLVVLKMIILDNNNL